jgi:hypothetical protein
MVINNKKIIMISIKILEFILLKIILKFLKPKFNHRKFNYSIKAYINKLI